MKIHEKEPNKSPEMVPEETYAPELLDKTLKTTVLNMLEKIKETVDKRSQGNQKNGI